jgi:hypothetical protein
VSRRRERSVRRARWPRCRPPCAHRARHSRGRLCMTRPYCRFLRERIARNDRDDSNFSGAPSRGRQ